MRALLVPLLALLLTAASGAHFAGNVQMKMTDGRASTHTLTYSIKGNLVRTDVELAEGQTASAIINPDKDQMTMLLPSQQMYMVMPVRRTAAAAGHDIDEVQIEKTGETEKILGYDCTKYLVKSNGSTTEVWATDELGTFMGLGSSSGPFGRRQPSAAWEKALTGKNFFPLRVSTAPGDKTTSAFRLEATAIKKESLPDSLFTPPENYRKLDMSGLPGVGGASPFGQRP